MNDDFDLLKEKNIRLLSRLNQNYKIIEHFKADQTILEEKMSVLYLKVDRYKEELKRKNTINRFVF